MDKNTLKMRPQTNHETLSDHVIWVVYLIHQVIRFAVPRNITSSAGLSMSGRYKVHEWVAEIHWIPTPFAWLPLPQSMPRAQQEFLMTSWPRRKKLGLDLQIILNDMLPLTRSVWLQVHSFNKRSWWRKSSQWTWMTSSHTFGCPLWSKR